MEIVQVVGLGLLTMVLVVIIREYRPEIAIQVAIAGSLIIILLVIMQVASIVQVITDISVGAGMNLIYLQSLLRIIGIAFIAEFGAQVCRDAGAASIASKIDFAAKVIILVIAIPIVLAVIESIMLLVP
ncbi:MAG: stage III sporulation protein AD [Firmicutes bacterium]|jgi:stage III sporulation protein AD|nr:stage III sporulation protein AD [Bacillota bacterium]NLZ29053.1 stage III sporulation protein AD [Bacillota bacterium]